MICISTVFSMIFPVVMPVAEVFATIDPSGHTISGGYHNYFTGKDYVNASNSGAFQIYIALSGTLDA